ncbi:MAG TPA: zinc ribbon domain-containing protein [Nitrososphaeraceae archaeon]|nr:zinc ribbon domain-containing protein [Nitrososphaeraceae archaeon]
MNTIHDYISEKITSTKRKKMKTSNAIARNNQQDNQNALFDMRVNTITEGLHSYVAKTLKQLPYENASAIVNFIMSVNTEINPSANYRRSMINALRYLSNENKNKKFKNMTRQDILDFLYRHRKSESIDPLHKWIDTYNHYRILLVKFFKWLYSPDIEPSKRPKPSVVENIPALKRKEISTYKPTDMWTAEDDLLFLKYCPSKRMKCYHMMSGDLSARPSEILRLKIKDVTWNRIEDKQYAEVVVNGKTGTRPLLLTDSIPYLKEYMNSEHPQPSNPNAPLICGTNRSYGCHITEDALRTIYQIYKKNLFPKLLESPNILSEDKQKIRELLKKRWNPYVRRHSALTKKSKVLKEHILRQHSGWSPRSQMHLKYLHYFGNEANQSLLEIYGIIPKDQKLSDVLKPKQCPNCSEPNRPDSKYCVKCGLVLSYDAYSETIEEKKQKDNEIQAFKERMDNLEKILVTIQPLLRHVKPEILSKLQIVERSE